MFPIACKKGLPSSYRQIFASKALAEGKNWVGGLKERIMMPVVGPSFRLCPPLREKIFSFDGVVHQSEKLRLGVLTFVYQKKLDQALSPFSTFVWIFSPPKISAIQSDIFNNNDIRILPVLEGVVLQNGFLLFKCISEICYNRTLVAFLTMWTLDAIRMLISALPEDGPVWPHGIVLHWYSNPHLYVRKSFLGRRHGYWLSSYHI